MSKKTFETLATEEDFKRRRDKVLNLSNVKSKSIDDL
jgi:hypothetical protein